MCGICGFISNEKLEKDILKRMNDTISYRGPDSEGYYLDSIEKQEIGLAHKRLAIMDLSPLGHQPMLSPKNDVIIVFNGEIYNFEELKTELIQKGYFFESTSDTEVIIKGYEEYGIEVVKKLNGMFAIAIFDKKNEEFYLIRDRLGVKPLYFYTDGEELVFASELKPIMEYPKFEKKINLEALDFYLYHGYIARDKSIFENTYKLLPGHYLKYKKGKIEIKEYWSVKNSFENREIKKYSEVEWKEIIKNHLRKSIKERMISDVPVGAFLSGGIDSTLIVSLMQEISDKPIKTYTIGFEANDYNEAEDAKKIANYLGTEHTEYYLTIKDAKSIIEKLPIYYDEPFADASQIATMFVSKIARKDVTVSLSGDGGDELFCGYSIYDTYPKKQKYKSFAKLLDTLEIKNILGKIDSKYVQGLYCKNDNSIINSGYLNYIDRASIIKNYKHRILKDYLLLDNLSNNIQEKAMLRDLTTYLPDDILTKVDRASMAFSLESRAPYVDDYKFVELSFQIPHNFKYRNGEKKYILKKVLYDYIPKSLMDRPKKGFGVPITSWLKNELKFLIDEYLSESFILKQNIFRKEDIRKIKGLFLDKNKNKYYKGLKIEQLLWNLIVFQLWYKKYMDTEK